MGQQRLEAVTEATGAAVFSTTSGMTPSAAILCPGQGAQAVGMGRKWAEHSGAARAVFERADAILRPTLGATLSDLCFNGPADRLNQTDVSQPAIFACSVACWHGMAASDGPLPITHAAGLSLGEYTALHLAGVFDFETGLRLVATRGRLMQEAAEASQGGMVALIGADDTQAQEVCNSVQSSTPDEVLVCANFNAPGQVVLSGSANACSKAVEVAGALGFKATPLTVAGAFHSPLMQPAADKMAKVLDQAVFSEGNATIWSNVTAQPHVPGEVELLKRRLVEQIVCPVQWSRTCQALSAVGNLDLHELAPGTVLRGLMRRIDRTTKVTNHDEPLLR